MAQPAETYHPQLDVQEGGEPAAAAKAAFMEASQSDPAAFQAALETIISPPAGPITDKSQLAARRIVDNLLDTTFDGFFIDYDDRFVSRVIFPDGIRKSLTNELNDDLGDARPARIRAIAARGLQLFLEHSSTKP